MHSHTETNVSNYCDHRKSTQTKGYLRSGVIATSKVPNFWQKQNASIPSFLQTVYGVTVEHENHMNANNPGKTGGLSRKPMSNEPLKSYARVGAGISKMLPFF